MLEKSFTNRTGDTIYYLEWPKDEAKCAVVISHGMAEHPERYDDLAKYLNTKGIAVYAINQMGHGFHAEIPGHMKKGDFDKCVSNLSELVEIAKEETGESHYGKRCGPGRHQRPEQRRGNRSRQKCRAGALPGKAPRDEHQGL